MNREKKKVAKLGFYPMPKYLPKTRQNILFFSMVEWYNCTLIKIKFLKNTKYFVILHTHTHTPTQTKFFFRSRKVEIQQQHNFTLGNDKRRLLGRKKMTLNKSESSQGNEKHQIW